MRSALSRAPTPTAAGRRAWPRTLPTPPLGARLFGLPRDVWLAGCGGVLLGSAAAATAYWMYLHVGGPTGAGIAVIPVSLVVVVVAYGLLARRHRRASDWLGLGYTVAVVVVTGLLMLWEILRGFYAELSFAAW